MNFSADQLLLYAVTDRGFVGTKTLIEQIEDALKGGVTILQLREKDLPFDAFLKEAIEVRKLCHKYNVPLIINDNVEIAIKSGADGVHVGIEDTPVAEIRKRVPNDFIIGATCKTVEQAKLAQISGANYMGVGAVFPSSTKLNAVRITKDKLIEIVEAVSIPAVAIGGITYENAKSLAGSKICGIAVVSAIFGAKDIVSETKKLKDLIKENIVTDVKKVVMPSALTIAGSDCSGGAGIQADLKAMTMNRVYAMSAITALTAQNTTGVRSIMEVTPAFLADQLDAVFEDITPNAVKIGMVSSKDLIEVIAKKLIQYKAKNVVLDPVMVATSGAKLMKDDAIITLVTKLFPLASLVTPNIPEASILSGMQITTKEEMLQAAKYIGDTYHTAVLLKGGHSINDANDLLYDNDTYTWFSGRRINNPNTHGTGCTLSSAIAANLAKGVSIKDSIHFAKEYLSGALQAGLDLGHGSGPLMHNYFIYKGQKN